MAKRAHGAYNKYVSYFDRIKRIEDLLLVTWTSGSPTMSIGTVPTFYVNTSTDRVGIRTAVPAYSAHFVVADGLIISSNNTDTTTKNFFVGSRHYTNAEEPFYWANGSCTNGTNVLNLGGGLHQAIQLQV